GRPYRILKPEPTQRVSAGSSQYHSRQDHGEEVRATRRLRSGMQAGGREVHDVQNNARHE
ncbi:MAG: hypothetical protein ACREIM_05375, partial [Nitrospiraceae bacterium]